MTAPARCPHCGQLLAGLPLPAGDGARVYCTRCGLLSMTDAAALEGLRRPTRAERNAAYSNPAHMAERASWLAQYAPERRRDRIRHAKAGFTVPEFAIVLAIVAILVSIPVGAWYQCTEVGKVMRVPTEWRVGVGCMAEVKEGQWVPLQNYRVTAPP